MSDDNHIVLGEVGVDSGLVAFCDPSHMDGLDYDRIVASIQNRASAALVNDYGFEVGVVAQTGIGDGGFPVTAQVRPDGQVQSVTVHFHLPEEAK